MYVQEDMTYLALSSSFCPNLYSSFCPQKSLLQTAHKPSNAIIFHLPVSTQVLMLALLEFLPVASRLTVSVVRSVATKSKCLDHATTNDLASCQKCNRQLLTILFPSAQVVSLPLSFSWRVTGEFGLFHDIPWKTSKGSGQLHGWNVSFCEPICWFFLVVDVAMTLKVGCWTGSSSSSSSCQSLSNPVTTLWTEKMSVHLKCENLTARVERRSRKIWWHLQWPLCEVVWPQLSESVAFHCLQTLLSVLATQLYCLQTHVQEEQAKRQASMTKFEDVFTLSSRDTVQKQTPSNHWVVKRCHDVFGNTHYFGKLSQTSFMTKALGRSIGGRMKSWQTGWSQHITTIYDKSWVSESLESHHEQLPLLLASCECVCV